MESTNEHEVNYLYKIIIILIISFALTELFIFIVAFYFVEEVEEVECHWWGCKFTSSINTVKFIDDDMTLEDIQKLINESNNSSYTVTTTSTVRCYFNDVWYNVSCDEVLNGKFK